MKKTKAMFEYHQPPYHHLFLVVLLDSWHAKEEEKDEKEEKLEMEPGGKESSDHKLSLRFWNSIPNGKEDCRFGWQPESHISLKPKANAI